MKSTAKWSLQLFGRPGSAERPRRDQNLSGGAVAAVNSALSQITPSTPLRACVFHEARKRIFINRPWPSAAAMKF